MTIFDIDTGSSNGATGPFISWQARESIDGSIPGRNWVLRDGQTKTLITDAFKEGVVFDLESLKTGWCYSTGTTGQAPQWKWNASLSQYEPSPGDGWKKGLSVRIAIDKDTAGTLEQSSVAIMSMLSELGSYIRTPEGQTNAKAGKLPVVKLVGAEKVEGKLGSTFVPRIEIAGWVDRPAILGGGAQRAIDIDTGPAPAAKKTSGAKEF